MPDLHIASDMNEEEEPQVTFAQLGVPGPLVHALADEGKRTAFPIQEDTLPDSLAGRDVLGRGRTGSGKTLAFSIPLVTRLAENAYGTEISAKARRKQKSQRNRNSNTVPQPRGLILAPTRELANQINEVVAPLAAVYGMQTTTVYGGVRYSRQINDLKNGADIVVACPGRLEDLIEQGALTLDNIQVVVLDEADEMADMGFLPPIKRILAQIPEKSQHMLFSATLDHGVDAVVEEFLHNPKVHSVDEATSAVDSMTHHVFLTTKQNKPELIHKLASGEGRRILFTRTKFQAKKLAKKLTQEGIPAAELHGNLNQNQRDRNLQAFESGNVNVLVATDVAARGIDVSGVQLVVQVDPPDDPKSFLHRSGRTARAGQEGDVITIITPDQKRYARGLLRRAGLDIKPLEVTPTSPQVLELVGTVAPLVEGWELPELKRGSSSRANRRKEREPRKSRNKNVRKSKRQMEREEALAQERRDFAQHFLGDVSNERAAAQAKEEARRQEKAREKEHAQKQAKKKRAQNKENGAKRIHRKEQRIVRDERSEDAKRHERRMKAREQERGRKSSRGSGTKRHNGKRNSTPFRARKGR